MPRIIVRKLSTSILKKFIPKERRVVWWDVENIAFHLDPKQEKWLDKHHIAVRGFMGSQYDKKVNDWRLMRFRTQLPEQSDHAISVWSGRWMQFMDKNGVGLSKLSTCVMTKDKFGDAWSAVLMQGGVKAGRITCWKELQRFFVKDL